MKDLLSRYLQRWVVLMLVLLCGVYGTIFSTSLVRNDYLERIDSTKTNVLMYQGNKQFDERKDAQNAVLSRNSLSYKRYRSAWVQRLQGYSTQSAVEEALYSICSAQNLSRVEDGCRVVAVNAKEFRVNYRFTGSPVRVLRWFAAIEEQVDFLVFSQVTIKAMTDQVIDVTCDGVVRLP